MTRGEGLLFRKASDWDVWISGGGPVAQGPDQRRETQVSKARATHLTAGVQFDFRQRDLQCAVREEGLNYWEG
jgi:hypothetical protein